MSLHALCNVTNPTINSHSLKYIFHGFNIPVQQQNSDIVTTFKFKKNRTVICRLNFVLISLAQSFWIFLLFFFLLMNLLVSHHFGHYFLTFNNSVQANFWSSCKNMRIFIQITFKSTFFRSVLIKQWKAEHFNNISWLIEW